MRIVERRSLAAPEPFVITGFPDVGLVGAIAAFHLIKQLKMEEMGYLESDLLPPIILLHGGEPKMPIRIYGHGSLYVIISEIAVAPELMVSLARTIVDFAISKNSKALLIAGGLATPERIEIEKPKVYGVATDQYTRGLLEKGGVEPLSEGFIVGINALLLKEAASRRLPSLMLLAQCHAEYPDPGAAASIVEKLNQILSLNVDVEPLLKEAEMLRLKLRELMRRTNAVLSRLQKSHEFEIPPMMYV